MERVQNNKGLSLVELVIAIAMSTIVIGAASMFLYNANRSYHAAEYSIDVQMEAQIIMEQLSNWVMESNRIYISPDHKVLVLYNIPRNNGKAVDSLYPESFGTVASNTVAVQASRRVIFASGNKLYMVQTTGITDAEDEFKRLADPHPGDLPVGLYTEADVKDENCICEFLEQLDDPNYSPFRAVKSPAEADDLNINSVNISLALKEGEADFPESYSVSNTFSSRNGLFGKYTPKPTPEAEPE